MSTRSHCEGYNSQQGETVLFLSGLAFVVEHNLVVMMSQGCTEMALVSQVTEEELQMLFLCHLCLTVMSLIHRCAPRLASQPARQTGGEASLSLTWLRAQPKVCLLSHLLLFVCLVLPERRFHNNPGKSICGFKVDLLLLLLVLNTLP